MTTPITRMGLQRARSAGRCPRNGATAGPEPRDVIGGLIEYAERYADQNDERDDGDCRETIAAARAILEAGFTVA